MHFRKYCNYHTRNLKWRVLPISLLISEIYKRRFVREEMYVVFDKEIWLPVTFFTLCVHHLPCASPTFSHLPSSISLFLFSLPFFPLLNSSSPLQTEKYLDLSRNPTASLPPLPSKSSSLTGVIVPLRDHKSNIWFVRGLPIIRRIYSISFVIVPRNTSLAILLPIHPSTVFLLFFYSLFPTIYHNHYPPPIHNPLFGLSYLLDSLTYLILISYIIYNYTYHPSHFSPYTK